MSKEETYFLPDGCMISADSTLISKKVRKLKDWFLIIFMALKLM